MTRERLSVVDVVGALSSVAVAAAWVLLALRRPTVTYHLAPLLVAAAWPVTVRVRGLVTGTRALVAVAGGLALAVGATAALDSLDALRGPALVGGSGTAEAALAAVAGAVWGTATVLRRRPGIVVRALGGEP